MTPLNPFTHPGLSFGLGIEDTCVYPVDPTRPALDEHELTDHHRHQPADLALAAELGAATLRYGASWPRAHPEPGRFDWRWLDAALDRAAELGLAVNLDLVHYGTPAWLPGGFADPGYPAAVEAFATAALDRFGDRLGAITPLNEPLTTASFCGLRGVWPPYLTGWDGWVAVTVPIALGIARTTHAARRTAPGTAVVHVEASTVVSPATGELRPHAAHLAALGWLPTDLVLGLVTPDHPMHGWLLRHGASGDDLAWLYEHPARPDLIGVNYYPDLTPRKVTGTPEAPVQLAHNRWDAGLAEALRGFADRYRLPLAVTETSIEGDDDLRSAWLRDSVDTVRRLRDEGVDLRGYTWWPLLDFIDWSWAAGGANVEEFAVAVSTPDGATRIAPSPPLGDPAHGKSAFLRRMGLVRLEEQPDGSLRREPTATSSRYRAVARGSS